MTRELTGHEGSLEAKLKDIVIIGGEGKLALGCVLLPVHWVAP